MLGSHSSPPWATDTSRVQELGVGLALDPEVLDADTLWKAVTRVAEDTVEEVLRQH